MLVLAVAVTIGLLLTMLQMGRDEGSQNERVERPKDGKTPANDFAPSEPLKPTEIVEQFNEHAGRQLQSIVDFLKSRDGDASESVSNIATADFTSDNLRPDDFPEVWHDADVIVRRGMSPDSDGVKQSDLVSELRLLFGKSTSKVRAEFKIVRVDADLPTVRTDILVHASARTESGLTQQNAEWKCVWFWNGDSLPPQLKSIEVAEFEEIVRKNDRTSQFVDCTPAAFFSERIFQSQFGRPLSYWREHSVADFQIGLHGHQGMSIGDLNGDGLQDLYICQPNSLPNRVFLRRLDGTLTDASERSGADWLDGSRSALIIDLDNDGDQDLAVTISSGVLIMENDGSAQFTTRHVIHTRGDPHSLCAADFDNDGDLDLYVAGYGRGFLPTESEDPLQNQVLPYPYHDANNGSPNHLLKNEGGWKFDDATEECGLDRNNRRWSFAASWEDFDNDGDADLYVANDYGRNNLYRNDDGVFADIAAEAGVEDIAAGMSVAWGDYNRDGLMDIYVANMFSSAGGRIAYQRNFQAETDESVRSQFQRHARGNTLFENQGDGSFRDVSVEVGVTMGRWAWGSGFVDINNDGLQDIVVANGYLTGDDTGDL